MLAVAEEVVVMTRMAVDKAGSRVIRLGTMRRPTKVS